MKRAIYEATRRQLEDHPSFGDECVAIVRIHIQNDSDGSGVAMRLEPDQRLPFGFEGAANEFLARSSDDDHLLKWLDEWTERQVEGALDRLEETIAGD